MSLVSKPIVTSLTVLGAASAAFFTSQLVSFLWLHFLRPSTNLRRRYATEPDDESTTKTSASWAVVTGASSGIGRACAMELARQGFNVVLISRTMSAMDSLANKIALDCIGIGTDSKDCHT